MCMNVCLCVHTLSSSAHAHLSRERQPLPTLYPSAVTDWDVCLRPSETDTGCVCLAQYAVIDSQGIEYLSFGGPLRGLSDTQPWCLTVPATCSNASNLNALRIGQPTQLNVVKTFPAVRNLAHVGR